ncbi:DUF1801 domain-containing protein [Dyella terrae]|uniref:DUF1801 domain-containing protein n=1 Tax=Dyella terrae TaxID=522259 RepID=UPI001EFC5E2C|nr:DUF1801 domain-containing protein [Dyella terrae]
MTFLRLNARSIDPVNPSERIDQLIEGIEDWRGKTLTGLRETILAADKAVIEEWKWMGSPVWSCDGMIAVANAHKEKVKITFMHGAQLEDPAGLFNAGLDGGKWRAIDWHEGDSIDKPALKALVRAAIAYNRAHLKKNAPARSRTKAEKGA